MRDIKKHIEQLEEAARQIDKRTPTSARLALLLLDNVIELFLYMRIQQVFFEDDYFPFPFVRPPTYSSKKREKIKKDFSNMVNFFVEPKREIDFDEGEILKIGHSFRNEAAHNGVIRDQIILVITLQYFEMVCRLLPRLWIGTYGVREWYEEHAFLRQYGIQEDIINQDVLSRISDHLLKGRTCDFNELKESLSQDLLSRIEHLVSNLKELAGPDSTIDDLLRRMLFYENLEFKDVFPDIEESRLSELLQKERSSYERKLETIAEIPDSERRTRELKKMAEEHKYKEMEKILSKYIREQLPKYQPEIKKIRINLKKIETWKRQAGKIESETMPGRVMRKFHDIDLYLRKIENKVDEALFRLEISEPY